MAPEETSHPLISIIVPCYNQSVYLPDALRSIKNQTYKTWECIIINDGSDDDTEEIASKWSGNDSRFRYILKENGGLSSARNAGINIASGKYILCLDADDMIGERYCELAIEAFQTRKDLSLVYCDATKFGFENGPWSLPPYNFKTLLLRNIIFCTAFFKKEDWLKADKYDEHLRNGWEDWCFWIKLLDKESEVFKIPEILFYYRTKESSMIKSMGPKHEEEVRWYIFKNQIRKYQQIFQSPIFYMYHLENTVQWGGNLEKENWELKDKLHLLEKKLNYDEQ